MENYLRSDDSVSIPHLFYADLNLVRMSADLNADLKVLLIADLNADVCVYGFGFLLNKTTAALTILKKTE